MSDECFDDFDYNRETCVICGIDFDSSYQGYITSNGWICECCRP